MNYSLLISLIFLSTIITTHAMDHEKPNQNKKISLRLSGLRGLRASQKAALKKSLPDQISPETADVLEEDEIPETFELKTKKRKNVKK